MLNINLDYLKVIKKLLAEHASGMIVWAYGSRVSGKSHEGSDLDLVVINSKGGNVPEEKLFALRNALQESNLPILVEVLDWSRIPTSFQDEIKKAYVVMQA
jgi:predicted nucleotidyltransferase